MSLSPIVSSLSRAFALAPRLRGESYFRQKRVTKLRADGTSVGALVQGSQIYGVSIKALDEGLGFDCECPYFRDNLTPCKHLWALILAAEQRGLLQGIRAGQSLDGAGSDEPPEGDTSAGDESASPAQRSPARREPPGRFQPAGRSPTGRFQRPGRPHARRQVPPWEEALRAIGAGRVLVDDEVPEGFENGRREILYMLDLDLVASRGQLVVQIMRRDRTRAGGWGKPRHLAMEWDDVPHLPDAVDRRLLLMLRGATPSPYYTSWRAPRIEPFATIPFPLADDLFGQACPTGRLLVRRSAEDEPVPLRYEGGEPWRFRVQVSDDGKKRGRIVTGLLTRGEDTMPLAQPDLFLAAGFLFQGDLVRRFDSSRAFPLLAILRRQQCIEIPSSEATRFMAEMLRLDDGLVASAPEDLRFEESRPMPEPAVRILDPKLTYQSHRLEARVTFAYGPITIEPVEPADAFPVEGERRIIRRDRNAENAALELLTSVGFVSRPGYRGEGPTVELSRRKLPAAVSRLLEEGWRVEAEGTLHRRASHFRMEVVSGVDWFDLRGGARFDDVEVPLPALLAALRKGEKTIVLGDGSIGLLPEEWLRRYAPVAELGERGKDHIRFSRAQAGFLDALLAAEPQATCDALFEKARGKLREFEGVAPAAAPPAFAGTLRPYQKEGLGWLLFLREFGFGGCLADDMGLGKTVQVLALLETLRQQTRGKRRATSLVIAPRSLVLNWMAEAARFAPRLRVLDHTGLSRSRDEFDPGGHDVVLTTYGTLVRDIGFLKQMPFDTVVLDEAQAIKNAGTQAAKAARLLHAQNRLALSGTPIENHLGELWSLVQFLNPGMLGTSRAFDASAREASAADGTARPLLARALRPFILRRTKAAVAPDLPAKTEQTLRCDLLATQRKLYDELRDHYRGDLLARVRRDGMARSKIRILEALLRLRQAACHPGLIDRGLAGEGSAKLDLLVPQLEEVAAEGHKALVFSQFTSLLALVKERLDAARLRHTYLDGSMGARQRAEAVRTFQEDSGCSFFLLSLKAGGYGLNLTAAEYVFLLDPWWNPAVEAQAIDRTHRIGQTRPVFAYRIVANATIEEKILDLHARKRELADSILAADASFIRTLSREDLELLLS